MKRLFFSLALLFCSSFLIFSTAHAATITVDTYLDDNVDNGNCSLWEAVQSANTNSSYDQCNSGDDLDDIFGDGSQYGDTIVFDSSTDGHVITTLSPFIYTPVSILGNGVANTYLENYGVGPILSVSYTGSALHLDGISIENGASNDACLYSGYSDDVRISNTYISGCMTGIQYEGYAGSSEMTIESSEIVNNLNYGIDANFTTAPLELHDVHVESNGWIGLLVTKSDLYVESSSFNENGFRGIYMPNSGTNAVISNSEINGNGNDGINISHSNNVYISGSEIHENGSIGVKNRSIDVLVENSEIEKNGIGPASSGGYNGGIVNLDGGSLTLDNSLVDFNLEGPGITNENSSIFIHNSIISNNPSSGIYNTGTGVMEITRSTISNNSSRGKSGGGIYNDAELTISETTIHDNSVNYTTTLSDTESGGGLYNDTDGTAKIEKTTFNDNFANEDGGAIYNKGEIDLSNSTLSSNSSEGFGGAIFLSANEGETYAIEMNSVTIAFNSSGISYDTLGSVSILNSILSDNTMNCSSSLGTINPSLGYNIDEDSSCGFTAPTDMNGINPHLDPVLKNNGGLTETHALSSTSPAIDTGSSMAPCDDQRGVTRPQDGNGDLIDEADRGAYEYSLVP